MGGAEQVAQWFAGTQARVHHGQPAPMSSPTTPPHPRRRNENSRQAILRAARDLVAEVGYQRLSIEGIATRAGVGKQTIYRWWRSKGAVVLDALIELNHGADGISLPDTGDLETDLKTVMRATVAEFADPAFEAPIRALTIEIADDADLAAQYHERLAGPMDEAKKERLRSAQRAGRLPADADLDMALELLYAPLNQRWLLRTGDLTPEYADTIVDHALRALRYDRRGPATN